MAIGELALSEANGAIGELALSEANGAIGYRLSAIGKILKDAWLA